MKKTNYRFLLILSLLIAVTVFAVDLALPLGVAAGVPYVVLVMLGLWFPHRSHILWLATVGTALTLAGYALSPSGGIPWIVFTNRSFAIFAIWVAAIFLYRYSEMEIERNKLSRAVDHASVGIVITDKHGEIEYANPQAQKISGYELDEVIGKTPRIFQSGITNPKIYIDLWKTISSGREWRGEFVNKAKGGALYWEDVSISPVFGRNGDIRNYIGIKEDITARKRIEDELATGMQKAEMASVAKSNFLSNMSHELRTPLNAIIGFSETMLMQILGPMKNDKYLDYAADIHASANHLRGLIDNVLDLSKVESGKDSLKEEDVDVGTLIHICHSLIADLAKKGGIKIVIDTVPSCGKIRGDAQKLRQVLLNLLSNAIKFTPKGGGICIRADDNQDGLFVLEVKDNGVGIPAESHENVFNQFEQVENKMTGSIKGTGLGLPLSRLLMEMHGGSLEMDSVPDQGTIMRMIFPAHRILTQMT